MKNLKKWWIFILLLLTTSFINFLEVLSPCTWRTCSDYLGAPVFTAYPNFFVKEMCGGIAGKCIPAHFSIWMFILDISLALIVFVIILCLIALIRKIFKK